MLKYLIIPLSKDSASFCNYPQKSERKDASYISPEVLSKIIVWAMKENLSLQFVYPDYPCPDDIHRIVESIDHVKIVPETHTDLNLRNNADIIVSENLYQSEKIKDKIYIIRLSLANLIQSFDKLKELILQSVKVNIIISNIELFSKEDIVAYQSFLNQASDFIASEIIKCKNVQFNLVTDRMMLSKMNNCNAGDESITVSLDGSIYPCPAFIGIEEFKCGNIQDGFSAPNLRLFQIKNAPICKQCDAYQCKRCVWLNNLLTHEVNTPSWQQCVISHIERQAAKNTLEKIRKQIPEYIAEINIPSIDYIDPYTKIEQL